MSKFKKVSPKRAFACLLVLFALLTVFAAMAENAAQTEAAAESVEIAARGKKSAFRSFTIPRTMPRANMPCACSMPSRTALMSV